MSFQRSAGGSPGGRGMRAAYVVLDLAQNIKAVGGKPSGREGCSTTYSA